MNTQAVGAREPDITLIRLEETLMCRIDDYEVLLDLALIDFEDHKYVYSQQGAHGT